MSMGMRWGCCWLRPRPCCSTTACCGCGGPRSDREARADPPGAWAGRGGHPGPLAGAGPDGAVDKPRPPPLGAAGPCADSPAARIHAFRGAPSGGRTLSGLCPGSSFFSHWVCLPGGRAAPPAPGRPLRCAILIRLGGGHSALYTFREILPGLTRLAGVQEGMIGLVGRFWYYVRERPARFVAAAPPRFLPP